MKAILIDPSNQTVTAIAFSDSGDYRDIATAIGAKSGLITAIRAGNGDTIYLDDEGLLERPNPHGYFRLPNWYQSPNVLAGKGLILGITADGSDTDARLSVKDVLAEVQWVPSPTDEEVEPTVTFIPFTSIGAYPNE